MLSVVSLGIGTPLIVISIVGWVKGSYADIAHHGKEPGYGLGAMPFFILAEAFIFIAFFGAYWVLRLTSPEWPPPGTPHIGGIDPHNNDHSSCVFKRHHPFRRDGSCTRTTRRGSSSGL